MIIFIPRINTLERYHALIFETTDLSKIHRVVPKVDFCRRHKPGGVFTAQTKYFFVRSITVSPHVTAAEDCDDLILFAVLDERPYQHGVNTVEMSMKIQIHNDSLSK